MAELVDSVEGKCYVPMKAADVLSIAKGLFKYLRG